MRFVFLVGVFLFFFFASCSGGNSTRDVIDWFCERRSRCCAVDYAKCVASPPQFQRTLASTLELRREFPEDCKPSARRARYFNMLLTQQPVATNPPTCKNHNDCRWEFNRDYIKVKHWMCSCPLEDRVKGSCLVKVCTPPAKVGERCAASPLPILCDSSGWCSIGEGDETGVCVAKKELGDECRRDIECKDAPDFIARCIRRFDSVNGKCGKAELGCGL